MNDLELEPITEEWLKQVGFQWHQMERQPDKHWLLWLGGVLDRLTSFDDLGIELAPIGSHKPLEWFCWLRADTSHKYSRFIHVRHISSRRDVMNLVAALTGQPWEPLNHLYGAAYRPEQAARLREETKRFDHELRVHGHPWAEIEKDDSRGGALPGHMQAAVDAGKAQ